MDFVDFRGFSWISLIFVDFSWIFVDKTWIFVDFRGFFVDCRGFFVDFSWISAQTGPKQQSTNP